MVAKSSVLEMVARIFSLWLRKCPSQKSKSQAALILPLQDYYYNYNPYRWERDYSCEASLHKFHGTYSITLCTNTILAK